MLEVYGRNRDKLALLQNAFGVIETKKLNAIDLLEFSLPENDPKNLHCLPFNHVRVSGENALYRIMPMAKDISETGFVRYECEHVIALLIDTVMFGFVSVGGLGFATRNVINHILGRQGNWVLDECDFARQFEYGWEQENLLAALFSVPNRFAEPYIWKFDTSTYPYRVSLKRLDESRTPDHYIRKGHNRLALTNQSDPRQICTRLYPLGAGEGVNQLGIASINNGIPYIQSPQSHIERYGIVERVWVDRRYENQQSLFDAAKAMLDELQDPFVEYEAEYVGDCAIGDIVRIPDSDITSFITEITKTHGEVPEQSITIANRPRNIAGTVADLADRQRIEMTYSQGATQLYADSIADNADGNTPLELRFFIPSEMRFVNAVKFRIRISAFRAYSRATAGGGAHAETTSSGGGTYDVTGGGGPPQTTSNSGGGATPTSSAVTLTSQNTIGGDSGGIGAANHNHGLPINGPLVTYVDFENQTVRTHNFVPSGSHIHAAHEHTITVPAHSHTINFPAHDHSIWVPSHVHSFNVPNHMHNITPVIEFFGGANGFDLIVNGQQRATYNTSDLEIDVTEFLIQNGMIPRGVWHTIGIKPNAIARVEMSYFVQGFIQSRGDMAV